MRIAISGSTGFIGTHLGTFLRKNGYEIIPLSRNLFNHSSLDALCAVLENVDVVINLAGAPIYKRWTKKNKEDIYNSRIYTTRCLVTAMNSMARKPSLFISASAIGYYDLEHEHDEDSTYRGDNFLSQVCSDWEAEASKISPDVRLVITRFAVVFSEDGGAFKKMLMTVPFRFIVRIGSNRTIISWVAMDDLLRAMLFIINKPSISGVVNIVAPWWISNMELIWAIKNKYHIYFTVAIPKFLVKLVLGEASRMIINTYKVHPRKLIDSGFVYVYNSISMFLLNNKMKEKNKEERKS